MNSVSTIPSNCKHICHDLHGHMSIFSTGWHDAIILRKYSISVLFHSSFLDINNRTQIGTQYAKRMKQLLDGSIMATKEP